jgi:hypothetical protein
MSTRLKDVLIFHEISPQAGAASNTAKLYMDSTNDRLKLANAGTFAADVITRSDVFNATTSGIVPLSGGGTTNFLRADGTWAAPGGGTIDGSGATNRIALWSDTDTLTSSTSATFDGTTFNLDGAAVFNESAADRDFRVETIGLTHALFVDASVNRVAIGNNSNMNWLLSVGDNANTNAGITAFNASNGSVASSSVSVINDANTAGLNMLAFSSGNTNTSWGQTQSNTVALHASTNVSRFFISAGGSGTRIEIGTQSDTQNKRQLVLAAAAGEVVVNEDASTAIDFRVEGASEPNLLFADASANKVGIGGTPTTGTLHVLGSRPQIFAGGGGVDGNIALARSDGSNIFSMDVLDGSGLGGTGDDGRFELSNGLMIFQTTSNAAGNDIAFYTGGSNERLRLDHTTEVVFNEPGNNYDFRIEGDNEPNLLFADASTDRIGIGTNGPSQLLDVVGNTNGDIRTRTSNTNTGNAASAGFNATADVVGVSMTALSSTQGGTVMGFSRANTVQFGGFSSPNHFFLGNFGADAPVHISGGNLTTVTGPGLSVYNTEVVVNNSAQNIDFRIETQANPNAFVVDASADTVTVGGDLTIGDDLITNSASFKIIDPNGDVFVTTSTLTSIQRGNSFITVDETGGTGSIQFGIDASSDIQIDSNGVQSSLDIEIIDSGSGIILTSPDSSRWRITVSDAGALVVTEI